MSNIIEITDFSDPRLDIYARIPEIQLLNRANPEDGIFIAESPKVIQRALNAGYKPISILIEKKHLEGEGREILHRCPDIPVFTAEFDILTKLTGFKLTRGMLCAMHRRSLPSVASICQHSQRIVVLENVVNPTNLGAVFRSAAALNMDAVLLSYDCTDPLYRRAIRVSMGTVFQVPWTFFRKNEWPDSGNTILHRNGFKTIAMALRETSLPIDNEEIRAQEKLAILLGAEGEGLSSETISLCDYTVMIPMAHGVDSLNVATAGAIAFYELGRSRHL